MAGQFVQLVGVAGLSKKIWKHGQDAKVAFAGAVYLYASQVITLAMRRTPVLTGYLRRSRWVQHPEVNPYGMFSITCGFSAPYAAAVHNRWARHPTGEWKFLSSAIADLQPTMGATLARTMNRLIKDGSPQVPYLHPARPQQWVAQRKRLNKRQRAKRGARAGINTRNNAGRVTR